MTSNSSLIPDDVRKFILEYVDSIEMLQVLVLLQEKPDREWSIAELTRELCSSDNAIEKRLNDLYLRKILKRQAEKSRHRFEVESEELRAVIAHLVECYHLRPYRIIELIYSRPVESLRAFADAFKIKKED